MAEVIFLVIVAICIVALFAIEGNRAKQVSKLESRIEFLQDRLLELATRADVQDALIKINSCNKYDILSVTSFLEEPISKVYLTDLIQTYCMFDHQIITLIDTNTSNMSCVHRGQARIERKFNSIK